MSAAIFLSIFSTFEIVNGYKPQFYFRTTNVTGIVQLPKDVEMGMPGDSVTVDEVTYIPLGYANLATGVTVTASSSLPNHSAADALDGKYETYWEAATKSSADGPVTLEIALPRQVTYRRIVLQEQIQRGQRVEAFTIEAEQPDGTWQKLAEATTIGYKRIVAVPETSATHLRIRFDSYRVAPTISEVELYY